MELHARSGKASSHAITHTKKAICVFKETVLSSPEPAVNIQKVFGL